MRDLRDMTPDDRIETLRWEPPSGNEVGRDTEGSFSLLAKRRKTQRRRHSRRDAKRLLNSWRDQHGSD